MRFFFDVVTANGKAADPEGREFQNLKQATDEAKWSAREIVIDQLRQGRPFPSLWKVEIVDDRGLVALILAFGDIVQEDLKSAKGG